MRPSAWLRRVWNNVGHSQIRRSFRSLAYIYRRFDFDVSAVKRERDIDVSRDYILGAQARDSPGIMVKVKLVE